MRIVFDSPNGVRHLNTEDGSTDILNLTMVAVTASRAFVVSTNADIAAFNADRDAREAGVTDFSTLVCLDDEPDSAVCHMFSRQKPTPRDEQPTGRVGPWRHLLDLLDRYFNGSKEWSAPDLVMAIAQARRERNDACLFGRYFKVSVREGDSDIWVATVTFQ